MPSLSSNATRVPAPPLLDPPTRGAEVVTRDGRSLPLVSARLHAEAQGGIARIVLEQRFENHYPETLHVTYRMPLPADGAVSGYAFTIAGRSITGRIERKRAAREQFERAIVAGHTAALLEQDRADIFTQSIGNLPAGEGLTVWIAVDQRLAWLPEGEWELRFPTVIGPRYVGVADTAEDARSTAVATRPRGVGARLQLAVTIKDQLAPGGAPGSPSHALQVGSDGLVELRDLAGARLDRDIVVRWPVAGAAVGAALDVARRADHDDTFGLITIVPPARAARAAVLPRDLIILLDTSGSMDGGPLDKAKQVVALLIESLGDDDRLELIEFSSEPRRYQPEAVRATAGEKQAALRWLRERNASGGTEMRAAVIEAMRALRPGAQRQVVLATDGYIGGEQQIVQQLHRDLPRSCRLHVIGVGSSVNRTLASSLARAGRGAEVLCDLDEDAERAAKRIIDRTRAPSLVEVTLSGSALVAQAPALLPDVYEGAPLVAAVQLRPGELVVRGERAGGAWEKRLAVRACPAGTGNQAIVGLFGREHVADLETRGFGGEATDREIERTGLAFQLATRFTSWIAVDQARVVTGPSRKEVMPQALPYGTTAAAFGLRGAARRSSGHHKTMVTAGEAAMAAPPEETASLETLMTSLEAAEAAASGEAQTFGDVSELDYLALDSATSEQAELPRYAPTEDDDDEEFWDGAESDALMESEAGDFDRETAPTGVSAASRAPAQAAPRSAPAPLAGKPRAPSEPIPPPSIAKAGLVPEPQLLRKEQHAQARRRMQAGAAKTVMLSASDDAKPAPSMAPRVTGAPRASRWRWLLWLAVLAALLALLWWFVR